MKKKTSTFYELWQWRAWQGRRWTCREGHPNQRLWSDQNTDSATQHQTQDRSGHPTLIWGRGNASAAETLRIGSEDRRWGWVGAVGQRRGSADGGSAASVRVESCSGFCQKKRVIRVERVSVFISKTLAISKIFFFFGWTCGGAFQTPHYYIWWGQLRLTHFGFFNVLRIQGQKVW